jgi:hypothetical protein
MHLVLNRQLTKLVGLAIGIPCLEPTSGEPDGESAWIMISTSSILFGIRLATKFTTEPNNGVIL